MPADGTWTLQAIDFNDGGIATPSDWSLTITGTSVPEPSTAAVATGSVLMVFALMRKGRR